MDLVFADLVQENTSTTGTGTLTLTGATAPKFQTFAAIGNANTTYYRIISGNDSEIGLGTYTLSGTTLSRDTVLQSIVGGVAGTTKITVAAGATVICTYPSEIAVYAPNSLTGILKGNGAAISAATAGTDYSSGTSALSTGIVKSTTTTGALTIATAADFPANYGTVTGVDTLVISQILNTCCCYPDYETLYTYNGVGPTLAQPVLTASSNYYQNISGVAAQAPSAAITLPNATTLAKGRTFVFKNAANTSLGFTLAYASATTLVVMQQKFTYTVILTDNSTTNGVWTVTKAPMTFPFEYSEGTYNNYYLPVANGGLGPMPIYSAGSLITYPASGTNNAYGVIPLPTTGKMLAYYSGVWGPVTYVAENSSQTWTGSQTFAADTTAFTATQANLATNASIVTTQAGATVVLAIGTDKTFYYSNVSGPTANMSLNIRMSGTGTSSTGSLNTALGANESTTITFILKQPAVPVNYINQILIDGVATNVTVVGLPGSIAGAIPNGITVTVINILKTAASTYLVYINATNY